jgi:hypothetical protein
MEWLADRSYDPGPALTVAKMPVKNPPTKPATRCVWKTPRVSSTYLNSQSLFLIAGQQEQRREQQRV